MKTEKKENMLAKQKYIAILKRNKQINKVNIFILAAGLLLSLVGYKVIGEQVLWLGIIIFIYTMGSNLIARTQMRKLG
ncbi:MAG: hypothetical protein JXA98_00840 [Methanosarcinaceae archaeon]|nr:hypothetical protein [Methanosarcinaceae archaeon]